MRVFLLLSLLFSFQTFGQDSTLIRLLDRIDRRMEQHFNQDVAWKNERTWALKFSPLHLAVGDVGFYFERRTGKRTSIEIGGGLTISDLANSAVENMDVFEPILDYGYIYYFEDNFSKAGFLGALEYRIYPLERRASMHHFYIAPSVKYKLYNYGIRDYTNSLPNTSGSDQRFNGYLNCGFQLWPAKKFVVDAFFGMGIGYRMHQSSFVNSFFENNEWKHYWEREENNEIRVLMNIGVKLGLGGGKS